MIGCIVSSMFWKVKDILRVCLQSWSSQQTIWIKKSTIYAHKVLWVLPNCKTKDPIFIQWSQIPTTFQMWHNNLTNIMASIFIFDRLHLIKFFINFLFLHLTLNYFHLLKFVPQLWIFVNFIKTLETIVFVKFLCHIWKAHVRFWDHLVKIGSFVLQSSQSALRADILDFLV